MSDPDRIVTVSTIRETPRAAERFVRRTLRSGVDHAVVFLDTAQPRVRSLLEEHPHVTVVPARSDYWRGRRPGRQAVRGVVNANVACRALTGCGSVRWLFLLDADEALAFDRDRLLGLGTDHVRFPTWEAVARRSWPDGEPRLFKKQPSRGELHALAGVGRIRRPVVEDLFRSHREGRPGVRPTAGARLRAHSSYDVADPQPPVEVPEDMHLLHHHQPTLDDFLAHWHDPRRGRAKGLSDRDLGIGAAFRLLDASPAMDDRERGHALEELFDRWVVDDVTLLSELDLLAPDPVRDVDPRPLPAGDVAELRRRLEELSGADKEEFRPPRAESGSGTGAS